MNFLESALFFMHLFLKRSLVLSSVNFKRECEGEELCCQIYQLPFIMIKVRKTKEKAGKTGEKQKKQLSFQQNRDRDRSSTADRFCILCKTYGGVSRGKTGIHKLLCDQR